MFASDMQHVSQKFAFWHGAIAVHVRLRFDRLLAALRFPLSCLNAVLLHGQRSVHPVKFEVESAGVAHGFAQVVSTPKGRGRRVTVRT